MKNIILYKTNKNEWSYDVSINNTKIMKLVDWLKYIVTQNK